MAETLKLLAQSNPAATTLTDIYTVPGATQVVISSIWVCNRSATATAFRIAISPDGAADANQHYLAYDAPILGNETLPLIGGIVMDAADVLRVYATLATLSFNVFGSEVA